MPCAAWTTRPSASSRGRLAPVWTRWTSLCSARTDDSSVVVEVIDKLSSPERVELLVRDVVTRHGEVLDLRRITTYQIADGLIRDIEIFEANQ